jgi:hypothetical protein
VVHRARNELQMNKQSGRNRNDQLIYANRSFCCVFSRFVIDGVSLLPGKKQK